MKGVGPLATQPLEIDPRADWVQIPSCRRAAELGLDGFWYHIPCRLYDASVMHHICPAESTK